MMELTEKKVKVCPRCNKEFYCSATTKCQCSKLELTNEQKAIIKETYTDCICYDCLVHYSKL